MLVINLFAGPGCGKSTLASFIYYKLKTLGYNAELVSEYAKELTWEENFDKLSDQLYVTAKQNRKLNRLLNKVDVVVTDSPLLLGNHYSVPEYLGGTFEPMVYNLFNSYNNLNILLNRVKSYHAKGRTQSEAEAKNIDIQIKQMLDINSYEYLSANGSEDGINSIFDLIINKVEEEVCSLKKQ